MIDIPLIIIKIKINSIGAKTSKNLNELTMFVAEDKYDENI